MNENHKKAIIDHLNHVNEIMDGCDSIRLEEIRKNAVITSDLINYSSSNIDFDILNNLLNIIYRNTKSSEYKLNI